jgi:phosphomannomutase
MSKKFQDVYIFDIDGTLTPSRRKMDLEFQGIFNNWAKKNIFFLVTGSDLDKTKEQLPMDIITKSQGLFCCCGNEYYIPSSFNTQPVVDPGPIFLDKRYSREFKPPGDLIDYLESILKQSKYHHRAGNHIEDRGSMLNFSVVGRNCSVMERENYFKWDEEKGERASIVDYIKEEWPELDASRGGQISIDIYLKGRDKSQIIDEIHSPIPSNYIFFGDRTHKGGNDYPLSKIISSFGKHGVRSNGVVHAVNTWEDTMNKIVELNTIQNLQGEKCN